MQNVRNNTCAISIDTCVVVSWNANVSICATQYSFILQCKRNELHPTPGFRNERIFAKRFHIKELDGGFDLLAHILTILEPVHAGRYGLYQRTCE